MKRKLGLTVLLLLLLVAVPAGWEAYRGNFHTVVDGEVYRSAQLSSEQLGAHIEQQKIRSVLNLRGPDPGMEWYDNEVATTQARGVTHADFLMTAGTQLTQPQMEQLIALMRSLPKPMLIHCWGGADRTGLASALYLYEVEHRSAEEAAGQLSVRYGHVPYLFWQKTEAMDHSLKRYTQSSEKSRAEAGVPPTGKK